MTATPFVREFKVGDSGTDCRAVKRALVPALTKLDPPDPGTKPPPNYGMDLAGNEFEEPAGTLLRTFKTLVGLLGDPIYTAEAHAKLAPYVDSLGVTLFKQEADTLAAEAAARARRSFTAMVELTIAKKALFRYTESAGAQPGGRGWFAAAPLDKTGMNWAEVVAHDGTLTCDCSEHWRGCGRHAGLSSPIFESELFTGTMLTSLEHIAPEAARPGDAVVFRGPNQPQGTHITNLLAKLTSKLADGQSDWRVGNMGGPGEPAYSQLSTQATWQAANAGAPTLVYLRLPV